MSTISNNNMNNRMSTSSTGAASNNNNNNNAGTGTTSTSNHQRRRSSSSLSSLYILISSSWLWRTMKKAIYDISVLIIRYIILYPIRIIQNVFFPYNDYDDATSSPAVSAKAAQQFVTYLRSLPLSTSASVTNSNTSDVSSGSTTTTVTTALNRDNRIMDGWYVSSFENAKQDAIMKQCLLVVYIYSPFHSQSDYVAKELLNSNAFLDYINQPEYIIAIGVSIHTSQGMKLSNILNITSYPALIVLQPESAPPPPPPQDNNNNHNNNRNIKKIPMQVIFRAESVQNLIPYTKIISYLISIITRYQVIIMERNMLKIQRDEEILLRKQQDDEYNNTLLLDQERDIRKQNELIQKEKELKQQELEQKLIYEKELNRIHNIQLKKLNIRPEPNNNNNNIMNDQTTTTKTKTTTTTPTSITSPITKVDESASSAASGEGGGNVETSTMISNNNKTITTKPIPVPSSNNSTISSTSTDHQVTSIRFILPNGIKINRKFYYDDTIDTLRSYIQVYYHETNNLDDIGTVGLSTNFPKQSYNDNIHTNQTLYDVGLYPQAVLMVQDLDL